MDHQTKILVVEDDYVNSELLEILLKRKGLNYLLAYDGLEALDVFENHPEIDLVLLDIKIPKLNGEMVLQKMKALRPNTPILVQTAYVFDKDRDRFFSLGCDDYIKKPIIKELFYEKIDSLLKRKFN